MGWVTDDAPTRAELDSCVNCGLCLPHCPTFRLTGDETASPRGRLNAMSAVAAGGAEVDEVFADIMGFCLECRACEAVCPSLVPFARAMEGARAEIAVQLPTRRRRFRHYLLGRLVAKRSLLRAGSFLIAVSQRIGLARIGVGPLRALRGLRRLPWRLPRFFGRSWRAAEGRGSTAAVLTGCVMEPWFGEVHQATVEVLQQAGYTVEAPAGQTCCGALAAHDGAADHAREMAARNVEAFDGYDLVVVDAAGCSAHMKEYAHWGGPDLAPRVGDVTEVVAALIEEGTLPSLPAHGESVAIQDPCHLRHAQRIVDEPRRILRAAGYEVVDVDPTGLCCGAAGAYALSHPQTSHELGELKASQVAKVGLSLVASANPGCEMQLRSHVDSGVRIAHPVELYWEALRAGAYSDLS